ncbi:hypothetical protein [Jiangella endophytica]|uniref:hypothetical protein n=1 Tax=Jiangella endophytica TaxID=1623398 RepID=UPI000E349D45|nr:hypothetical protein [Jiangella endophytica]
MAELWAFQANEIEYFEDDIDFKQDELVESKVDVELPSGEIHRYRGVNGGGTVGYTVGDSGTLIIKAISRAQAVYGPAGWIRVTGDSVQAGPPGSGRRYLPTR